MKKKDKILKKDIKKLDSLYLVCGNEHYLIDQFKTKFINTFISDEIKDFNLTYLDDEAKDLSRNLRNYVNTLPVMAEKRFIVLECKELFTKKTAADDKIIAIIKNIPDSTVLLVVVKDEVRKELSLYKEIKKAGEVINLSPPRYKKLDSWIVEKFKEKNKKVDKKSINLLEHMFNNKLDRLNSEIEKIVTCFPEKELINFKDIKKIISKDRLLKQNIIFDFVDALSKKEKGKAIKILNEMIEAGEIPLMILAMVTRQIRLLLSVKELKNQGNSSQKIADILNEHPYPIKKCYRFSDNFTVEELEILLERVLETNLDMVTGKYDNNNIALEMTLLEIK